MDTRQTKTQQIHVVHIIPTLNFGGAEKFVVELTKHVPREHIRQTIITLYNDRPLLKELPEGVVCEVIPLLDISRIRRMFVIAKRLKELKADIVHTHLFSADVWGRLGAWYAHIPVVTTEHNLNVSEPWLFNVMRRYLRGLTCVYTAPSQAVVAYMKQTYHIPEKKIHLILHGIDTKQFSHTPPTEFKTPYRLGIIGRVVEQKGHRIAIDALKHLKDISCELHITGEGDKKEELKKYTEDRGIANRIVWHEPTRDIASVYASCDIVLVPSLWEGLGLVVLEAMASGRLVIASAVDGIREIVQHNETGMLFSVGNSSALAEAIEYAIAHVDESQKIAEHARVWVVKHADISEMAERYEELYQDIYDKNV